MMTMAAIIVALSVVSSCVPKSQNNSDASTQFDNLDPQLRDLPTDDPLTLLKKGNKRFVLNKTQYVNEDSIRVKELIEGQNPKAIIVGCSDSRVAPEVLFDQGLGDLFIIRTAGNVMDNFELGSIEYAAEHLHTKLIVVMGHTSCGAIQAMLDHCNPEADHQHAVPGHIASIVKALEKSVSDKSTPDQASISNVRNGVNQLKSSEPILKGLFEKGKVQIVGAIYHIETGEVEFLDI